MFNIMFNTILLMAKSSLYKSYWDKVEPIALIAFLYILFLLTTMLYKYFYTYVDNKKIRKKGTRIIFFCFRSIKVNMAQLLSLALLPVAFKQNYLHFIVILEAIIFCYVSMYITYLRFKYGRKSLSLKDKCAIKHNLRRIKRLGLHYRKY